MKKIILCADDYGQHSAVSDAIIKLIDNQRISAVSCLMTGTNWQTYAKKLLPYRDQVDIGLHLELTESPNFLFKNEKIAQLNSLNKIIVNAFLRQIDKEKLKENISLQLNLFFETFGCYPDFIDGHQHIHHLPMIREALIAIYQNQLMVRQSANLLTQQTYLRIAANSFTSLLTQFYNFPKAQIIALTGGLVLKRKVKALNIPHNASFAGVYNFRQAKAYRYYFNKFLKQITEKGLIMCHPGLVSDDQYDPIASARVYEYQYFLSNDFLADCKKHNVVISRMQEICHKRSTG